MNHLRSRRNLALLTVGIELGCTTPMQPKPEPALRQSSAANPQPEAIAKPESPPISQPPAPIPQPEAIPQGSRLPWVNPARCLPLCAFDPSSNLVRVSDLAEPDAKGRHRVSADVQPALRELLVAARAAGHALRIESAFRSYDDQARLFSTMKEAGRAARPGHSEHQLGAAIDLRLPTGAAIGWLAAHAADFAFALSYPPNKQRVTGYRPEPWHVRYVGQKLAEELRTNKSLLEEAFRAHPELAESGTCADCPLPLSRAACDSTPSAGLCNGSVLTWCYDGALATVDCAVSGQRCGQASPGEPFDCLQPPPAKVASKTP